MLSPGSISYHRSTGVAARHAASERSPSILTGSVVRVTWTSAGAGTAWARTHSVTRTGRSITSNCATFPSSGGTANVTFGARRVDPGEVRRLARGHDRGRQAADDRQDDAAGRTGRQGRRPGAVPPGAVLRSVLLRRAEDALVRADRGDPE